MLHLQYILDLESRILEFWTWNGSELGPEPESNPAGFCVLFRIRVRESKLWEKTDPDPESLFNFGSSRSLCGEFLCKNMRELWLDR